MGQAKKRARRAEPSVEEQLESMSIPFLDKFDELFDADDLWAAGRQRVWIGLGASGGDR